MGNMSTFKQKIYNLKWRLTRATPAEVVRANTREAFNWFFAQDDYIDRHYLDATRLALYGEIADYCTKLSGIVKVLDVGCGTGHMLKALVNRLPDIEIYGIDFAESAIRKAKQLLPTGQFTVQDIYISHGLPGKFDLVLCIETLEHLREPEKVVAKLCQAGRHVVITVPNGTIDTSTSHIHRWSYSELERFLRPHGLRLIKGLQSDKYFLAHLEEV